MERLRKYIENPVSHKKLNPTHPAIKVVRKTVKDEKNNEAILSFFESFQLNVPNLEQGEDKEKDDEEQNTTIGKAIPLDKTIVISHIEKDVIPMKKTVEQVDDLSEEGLLQKKKGRKKDNEIVMEEYRNGLANAGLPVFHHIPGDQRHDLLDMYRFYDNGQDPIGSKKKTLKQLFFSPNKISFFKDIQKKFDAYFEYIDAKKAESPDVARNLSTGFQPFLHQHLIKQYLNTSTPYRGVLLYHGLGSGKTCTSIGLIEAMKETIPQIYILTPASLKQNYVTQIKKCGSSLFSNVPYNRNLWRFVEYPEDETEKREFIRQVKVMTKLPDSFFSNKKRRGLYLRRYGFGAESDETNHVINEKDLEDQIQMMIERRFKFISYNGITTKMWNKVYKEKKKYHNPFNHSIVIIDEGHNFVSRIINKLNTNKESVSTMIYEDLISAENCKVVVLSGTPLINYPSEMGVMFNIINGANRVITLKIKHLEKSKMKLDYLKQLFKTITTIDYIEFEPSKTGSGYATLKVLRNPYGFKKEQGDAMVQDFKKASISTEALKESIKQMLKEDKYKLEKPTHHEDEIQLYKSFPDTEVEFNEKFVHQNKLKNGNYFKQKILGSVSYIGDDKTSMPRVVVPETLPDKEWYKGEDIFIEEVKMTPYVLEKYKDARELERKMDKRMKQNKKGKDNQTSSYKLYSRAACNFVFPSNMKRPFPDKMGIIKEEDLEDLNLLSKDERMDMGDGTFDRTDLENPENQSVEYRKNIMKALNEFANHPERYFESDVAKRVAIPPEEAANQSESNQLTMYSPKFHRMLQNIVEHCDEYGVQLLYSNFRTLEGIGIFKIILDYYGFTEFKIKANEEGGYTLDIENPYYKEMASFEKVQGRRKFYALYTGTESVEVKEMIRNIYNGNVDAITDPSLKKELQDVFNKGAPFESNQANLMGEIIELLMITSSGAEGIDLKNVRYVHITEPYWHAVRISQVIGRGRRIGSHLQLPEDVQDIKVYMYMLIHDKDMLKKHHDKYRLLIESDSERGGRNQYVYSTDETLYRIMYKKKQLMDEFLTTLKESSIDCSVNYEGKEEGAKCFKLGQSLKTKKGPLYHYNYKEDKTSTIKVRTDAFENNNDIEV